MHLIRRQLHRKASAALIHRDARARGQGGARAGTGGMDETIADAALAAQDAAYGSVGKGHANILVYVHAEALARHLTAALAVEWIDETGVRDLLNRVRCEAIAEVIPALAEVAEMLNAQIPAEKEGE